ncbi:MAG: hypothetical protein HC814_04830 [Rhodobacteraceae bacterium]|nr:hypothetical protein [Paracoccaceae bacterium]
MLEVTNNWAGPIACRHLADLGAEVIKVELATRPATRGSHYIGLDPGKEHWNRSGYFNEMNRNKRDISLNLATPRGRELFLELAKGADALVENNSARVMPNWGLDYDGLRALNPRVVAISLSGFGRRAPHDGRTGHARRAQSRATGSGLREGADPDPATRGPLRAGIRQDSFEAQREKETQSPPDRRPGARAAGGCRRCSRW